AEEKDRIIRECHVSAVGGSHFGRDKTCDKVTERYYWIGIQDDVEDFIGSCDACQRNNPRLGRVVEPLHPMPVTDQVWHTVGIDLVGPLPETARHNRYIAVAVDLFSKYPEAQAIPNKEAATVRDFLLTLIYRHGCPRIIITDQGREFVNQVNEELM